jgi:hypothetical protein
MKKLGLIAAFAVTIIGTAAVTGVFLETHRAAAQEKKVEAPPPEAPAAADSWAISAYISGDAKSKTLTNGFVVINTRSGKVSNCVANWMGQKDAKCYDWSWVKLP